jgi:ABC-type nitrate/sulfonate/bicarbonate transport system substrate-binding protein
MRAVMVLVALLALAGCGGDDEQEQAGGQTTLKVQETAGVPSAFVGFGIEQGIFERHGLQIELEQTQGGAATLPALVNGDVQVGGSNVVSLLIASSKGLPVQAIAPGTSARGAGQEDFGALLAAPKSGIRDARDFEGSTVAVNTLDNIAEVVVKAALEKEGADPSKVKLIEVPFPEMGPAMERGDVQGAFSIEPFVTTSVQSGAKVVNYSYVATEPDMQVGAYAVARDFAAENGDAVEAFKAAVADTAQYVGDHQDEFRTYLSEEAQIEPRLAERIVLPQWTQELNMESLESTAELMQKYGLVEEPVDAQQLVGG